MTKATLKIQLRSLVLVLDWKIVLSVYAKFEGFTVIIKIRLPKDLYCFQVKQYDLIVGNGTLRNKSKTGQQTVSIQGQRTSFDVPDLGQSRHWKVI